MTSYREKEQKKKEVENSKVGAQTEENTLQTASQTQPFEKHRFYYLNQNKKEIKVERNMIENFIIKQAELDPSSTFQSIEVKNVGSEQYLFAEAGDAQIAISLESSSTEGAYLLGNRIHKCFGCEEGCKIEFNDGEFRCTSCEGQYENCTKTDKAILDGYYSPSDFIL